MSRLFALADLHLSEAGHKPMDRFGEAWRDHSRTMAAAWDRRVGPEDTVLLAGDLSWGRNLDEAAPDLAWIGRRPGRKILLKGNHDSWWSSAAKVRSVLPAGCELLHHTAVELERWVVVGARGWLAPDDPMAGPGDAKIFHRELGRLRRSLDHARGLMGAAHKPRVAMLHYPPWLQGRPPTAVVPLLQASGVSLCVYGHLHGEDHRLAVTGRVDGVLYRLVAVDAVGFEPVELPGPEA